MSPSTQWRRSLPLSATGYALVLLTMAAAILRLIFLNSKSLWLDEGISAMRSAKPLGALIRELLYSDTNMALYQLIQHWWSRLAGSSEISLRFPSVIFATATVPLIYTLGTELVDRRVGLLAALLLCVNVSSIQYAQEGRAYAMVIMLVTVSSVFFVRSVKQSSFTRLRDYLITGPWPAYTQLFGILILPAQWLSLFLFRTDRKTRFRLTLCIAVVALLSLPAIILAMLGEHGQVSWIRATTGNAVLRVFAMFAGVYWGNLSRALNWLLFATYLATIGIAVARASEREHPVVGFLLLSVVTPVVIALIVSIFKPLFVYRYLLICQPFFVLLAAVGLTRIKSRSVMVAITVLIVALSLSEDWSFYRSGPQQDWRGAINFVAANATPGDVLLVFPEWNKSPVDYYVGRLNGPAAFHLITDRLHSLDGTAGASNAQDDNLRRFLARHGVNSYMRVWIVTDTAHLDEPAMHQLEIGHQVTAGPRLAGLLLARID
jgi:mannosyltransferase